MLLDLVFALQARRHDDGVDDGQRRGQGVGEGGHVGFCQQDHVRHGADGRIGLVREGDGSGAPGLSVGHGLGGPSAVAGEADADEGVPLVHADHGLPQILEIGGEGDHVAADVVQVVGQEHGQRHGGPKAQHVDLPGLQNGLHRLVEGLLVRHLHGGADGVHVRGEDGFEDLVFLEAGSELRPLDRGEPAQDHLLHPILQGGIAVQAQGVGEADHRGFGHPHGLPQPGGGHEGRLLVAGDDEVGDALLALGEAGQALLYVAEQIVHRFILSKWR